MLATFFVKMDAKAFSRHAALELFARETLVVLRLDRSLIASAYEIGTASQALCLCPAESRHDMLPRCTVLVVEDEPLILMAACDMVESAGFSFHEAANAEKALSILGSNTPVAVLFTDIDMPGTMDGIALSFYVRARWPHMGIIITSGRWAAPQVLPAGTIFLEKPYLSSSIAEALRIILP